MPESVKRSNLQRSIKGELRSHQVEAGIIAEVEDVTICSCLDEAGNFVNDDCLEDCKHGNFNAQVWVLSQVIDSNGPIEDIGSIKERTSVSGNYCVTNYSDALKEFVVELSDIIVLR